MWRYILRDKPLEVCGKMGALAASYCVEKPGTQTFGYSLEEFCKRYEENFNEKLELGD
jgi:adenosine kinase